MATATDIAAACRQLASQVQTVHHPNVQNAFTQIGQGLGALVQDGEQVLQGNFNPLQQAFDDLNGPFNAVISWLEGHPPHLLNLASQLEAIAGEML